jgi:oxysterol-binding protein 1
VTLPSFIPFLLVSAKTGVHLVKARPTSALQRFTLQSAVPLVRPEIQSPLLPPHSSQVETVSLLLSHRSISPNAIHPPASGTTALHLAASLGRADVVNLLLEQDGINDTLRDSNRRTCIDVARGKDVLSVINGKLILFFLPFLDLLLSLSCLDSRSLLTASYRSLLRTYILSPRNDPPSPTLIALLSSPRARLVDLSYLDDASGTTLLHEATRRKDLRLIEMAVLAGADVFIRDRRGRAVQEVVGKDDKMRVFLRQCGHNTLALFSRADIQLQSQTTIAPSLTMAL